MERTRPIGVRLVYGCQTTGADWPVQTRPLPLSLTLSGRCITSRLDQGVDAAPSDVLRLGGPSGTPGTACGGPSGTPHPARGAPQVNLFCTRAPQVRPLLPTGIHSPSGTQDFFFFNVYFGLWVSYEHIRFQRKHWEEV